MRILSRIDWTWIGLLLTMVVMEWLTHKPTAKCTCSREPVVLTEPFKGERGPVPIEQEPLTYRY